MNHGIIKQNNEHGPADNVMFCMNKNMLPTPASNKLTATLNMHYPQFSSHGFNSLYDTVESLTIET
jgi:hypothetical protein